MSKTRIYVVSHGNAEHFVNAGTQAQARNHIARRVYSTRVATQTDLVKHLQAGGKIEEAGADDEGEQS